MSYFQSKTTLMLAMALLLVGLSLVYRSVFSSGPEAQSPAVSSGPGMALASGASASSGYTDRLIATNQEQLKANPQDVKALAGLGTGYLQKARETNDPTFYAQAETALQKALEIQPDYYDGLAGMGSLELSRHAFKQAEEWGTKAQQTSPGKAYAYGVIGDARVELGNYDGAIESFQQMVDLRPDLGSYSRVSYARELYGDIDGAIDAMQQAIEAGSPAAENTAWCRVQLGNLYFNSNRAEEAEQAYNEALRSYPNYLHAQAALAQLRWTQGKPEEAITLYKQSVASVPLPQYLTALGDLHAKQGNTQAAQEQYDLVQYIFKVFETNGVDVAVEKAAFLADYDLDTPEAAKLIEEAAKSRNDIHTQDTLAWTLYRAGRYQEALAAQENAMRLGTKNPLFYFHLGMIQAALDDKVSARASLQKALDINPNFSIRYVTEAKQMLDKLAK
ncbi:MAG: tetratricopeptide repeat protein [Chloroflexia bacterium]